MQQPWQSLPELNEPSPQTSLPCETRTLLKSLVIRDTKSVAATLRLAGREPLSKIFRNLPIDQDALTSPAKLLHALKGSEVKVSGGRTIRGRIVAVVPEKIRLGDGLGATTRHRVSLLTSMGLQHFILEESQSIQFSDPKIVSAVQKGLAAIEENRAQDKRILHIRSSGAGRRTLSAGYVVRVPVWKTTYRLTLPALPALPALDHGKGTKVPARRLGDPRKHVGGRLERRGADAGVG